MTSHLLTALRWTLVALAGLAAAPARASFDAPGQAAFDFLADDQVVYGSWDDLPGDELFTHGWAEAYFSSDASVFGEGGAFVWLGFALEDPGGSRYGMLLLDLDLEHAPFDGVTSMPANLVRATYLEKRGDQLLFEGTPVLAEVWIVDVLFHEDDQGGVEGDFAFVFADDQGVFSGSRAFVRGHFFTQPSPAQLRSEYGIGPVETGEDVDTYVDLGCGGDVYWSDDPDSDEGCDCEGDSSDDGSSGSDSCEGDSGSTASADSCEGDSSGSSSCSGCEGDAKAAVPGPRRAGGGPLRALQRWLPELALLACLAWLRRRPRR
jgi:hypothetical protein